MFYIKQKAFTFKCDSEPDMLEAREKVLNENAGFSIIKEKKDFKTKKSKGEIIDEFWLYTVTVDLLED